MTAPTIPKTHALVEDLLLLLFDPRSGDIAGEDTLFYTLGAAVAADLLLQRSVDIDNDRLHVIPGEDPTDPLLRGAWDRVARKPVDIQEFITDIGPALRPRVLERIVGRGDIHEERRRFLGLLTRTVLVDGGTPRRAELVAPVRAALVGGGSPEVRTLALAALLSASGSLPTLAPEIPSSDAVYTRGKELENRNAAATALEYLITQRNRSIATGAYNTIVDRG